MDISKLCRSCMKEVASWEIENFNQRAVEMFTFCTNIQIIEEDKLPKQFCYDCTIKIESSYTYIKRAMEVNATLNNLISRLMTSVIVDSNSLLKNVLIDSPKPCVDSNINVRIDSNDTYCFNDLDDVHTNQNDDLPNDIGMIIENNMEKCFKSSEIESTEGKQNIEHQTLDIYKTEPKNTDEIKKYCQICKKVFMLDKWLKKHIEKQHSGPKSNDQITENIETDNKQDNETMSERQRDGKQVCQLCGKTFTSKLWFSRHVEKEHSANKIYFCSHCPKSFPTYHLLRYHQDLHSEERRFACDTCGKRFKKRKHLAKHCVTHGQDRPFACDQCHMTFKIKSILTSHMKVHENNKPYLCYICGRSFGTAGNLEQHMSVHSGSRPHACPLARCAFRSSSALGLRRHALRHRGERPHACDTCHKRFTETGSLVRHKRTHTGERPYKCPSCELRFVDSWKRKSHMMRAHRLALGEIPRLTRDGRPAEW